MKTKKLALYALLVALGLIFSYIESFINLPLLPGVKLGLANGIVLLLLAVDRYKGAAIVNLVRIAVSSLLFANLTMFFFSVLGAALSLAIMILAKRLGSSLVFTSFLGGVFHNIGQLVACFIVFGNFSPVYYLPFLVLAGAVCGLLIGTVCQLVIKNKSVVNLLKNF